VAALGSPPEPWWLRAPLLSSSHGWRRRPGGSQGRVQAFIDRELEARASPRVPSRGGERAWAWSNSFARRYVRVYPMGIAPDSPGDPGRVSRGVSRSGTLDPKS
jgi:hypothetical protein